MSKIKSFQEDLTLQSNIDDLEEHLEYLARTLPAAMPEWMD